MAPPNPFWVQRYLRDHNLDALLGEAVNQVRCARRCGCGARPRERWERRTAPYQGAGARLLRSGLTPACGAGGGAAIDRPRRLAGAILYRALEAQRRGDQDLRAPDVQQVCACAHVPPRRRPAGLLHADRDAACLRTVHCAVT